MYNSFKFCSTVLIPQDITKYYSKGTSKKMVNGVETPHWVWNNLSFIMKDGINSAFVKAGGGHFADESKGSVYTLGLENNKLEIPWKDRDSSETLKLIADYAKFKCNLDNERAFSNSFDFVEFLEKELMTVEKERRIVVTGDVKPSFYNGQITDEFIVKSVRYAYDDEKSGFYLNMDVYFNEDSIDETRFDEEKVIDLMGYTYNHIDKELKMRFVPHAFVLNGKKLDFDNPDHKRMWDYQKKYITAESDEFVHMAFEVKYVRGAEEVEFTEDMLTEAQKEQILFGQASLEDFKPRGTFGGNNIVEYRIIKPNLKIKGFADGIVQSGLDREGFEALIYRPAPLTESFPFDNPANKETAKETESTDEDLFS